MFRSIVFTDFGGMWGGKTARRTGGSLFEDAWTLILGNGQFPQCPGIPTANPPHFRQFLHSATVDGWSQFTHPMPQLQDHKGLKQLVYKPS